jgi:hypothetical protein
MHASMGAGFSVLVHEEIVTYPLVNTQRGWFDFLFEYYMTCVLVTVKSLGVYPLGLHDLLEKGH